MVKEFEYYTFYTSLGWVGLLGSEYGIRGVTLPQPAEKDAEIILLDKNPSAKQSGTLFQDLAERISRYYEGKPVKFPDKLDLNGATPFQRAVWRATVEIPYGETRSYGWVAGRIGKPKASRAVGQALHRNPIPLIVPCHRVLGSSGQLVGFGGGIDVKKILLDLEKQSQ